MTLRDKESWWSHQAAQRSGSGQLPRRCGACWVEMLRQASLHAALRTQDRAAHSTWDDAQAPSSLEDAGDPWLLREWLGLRHCQEKTDLGLLPFPRVHLDFSSSRSLSNNTENPRQGLYLHNERSQNVPGGLLMCVWWGALAYTSAYPHSTAGRQVEQVRSSTFQKKALER